MAQQAFKALVDIAERCKHSAVGLPAQVDITPHWSGVGFTLLGRRFVAPLGEVTEMLELPPFTRLPGVQGWVRGVANVRGRLLPMIDLAEFFGERLTSPRKQRRVLVLEVDDIYSGLIVDQVFGMQHFPVDAFQRSVDDAPSSVAPFLQGCYRHNDNEWAVFSPSRLLEDPRFLNAAAGAAV